MEAWVNGFLSRRRPEGLCRGKFADFGFLIEVVEGFFRTV
jgi:hypothetical protein